VSADFGRAAWVEAGAADAWVVGFVDGPEVFDAEGAGVRSEAGRALTPWRYASAMAVTIRT
jgi:hypothetical protein